MSDYASIDNEERREPESEPGRSSPFDARHSHHKVLFIYLFCILIASFFLIQFFRIMCLFFWCGHNVSASVLTFE